MNARYAATAWLALTVCTAGLVRGSEPLPQLAAPDFAAELTPMQASSQITSEAGFFERWRAGHQQRAARDGYIETDRPSFTLSPTIVPQGWVQVEAGFISASEDSSIGEGSRTDIPLLNLRVGLLPRVELRILWGGASDLEWTPVRHNGPTNNPTMHHSATSSMAVGLKFQVSQQSGWIPQSALVTDFIVPTGDFWGTPYHLMAVDASNTTSGLLDYIYFWLLGERFAVGGSTGMILGTHRSLTVDTYFQSAILKFFWTPRLTLFTEYYAIFMDDYYNSTGGVFDFGIKWHAYNNLQYDFIAAFPGVQDGSGFYCGAGVSYRY